MGLVRDFFLPRHHLRKKITQKMPVITTTTCDAAGNVSTTTTTTTTCPPPVSKRDRHDPPAAAVSTAVSTAPKPVRLFAGWGACRAAVDGGNPLRENSKNKRQSMRRSSIDGGAPGIGSTLDLDDSLDPWVSLIY